MLGVIKSKTFAKNHEFIKQAIRCQFNLLFSFFVQYGLSNIATSHSPIERFLNASALKSGAICNIPDKDVCVLYIFRMFVVKTKSKNRRESFNYPRKLQHTRRAHPFGNPPKPPQ